MTEQLGFGAPVARLGRSRTGLVLFAVLGFASCGEEADETAEEETTTATPEPARPAGPLLEEDGALAESDLSDGRGRYDRYFVEVAANDRILVTLTSSTFDPILEVTPPSSGLMVNDDYQGDRTRSQLELIASTAGQMKIEVRAYANRGTGAYHVAARRVGDSDSEGVDVPVLSAGSTHDGEIDASDAALSGGARYDSLVVNTDGGVRIAISAREGGPLTSSVVGPDGLSLAETNGAYLGASSGNYRVQVMGAPGLEYRVAVTRAEEGAIFLSRAHHEFSQILSQLGGTPRTESTGGNTPRTPNAAPRALPVRIGDRLNGNLAENDARLPSGELYDVYELNVRDAGETVAIEMASDRFDSFLRVEGPGAEHWENDDAGGTLNSRVEIPLTVAGRYRIVTTSYRPGQTGPYELKVLSQRDAGTTGGPNTTQTGGPEQRINGELRQGDSQIQSGEFADDYTFEWPAGARIHLEARSTEFDTYLIVHPPNGPQQDNDDMNASQGLNAGLDLQVTEAGAWRVTVTSYSVGMTGAYELVVTGASGAPVPNVPNPNPNPTPTPPAPNNNRPPTAGANVQTGELAQGDRTLRSGEFMDSYPMTFTPQSQVSIRLDSSDFDTYLIIHTPSGQQEDNDDVVSGNLNSGFDIQVAEPGNYEIVVTSYRPGEVGQYTLTVTEGASVVGPPPTPPGQPRPPGSQGAGGRVWGLFAGITDYPGSTNDLPECANDARKLAEAVRNQGNMPPEQEFLFTDSQATTAAIRTAMETINERIGPDDVFVFFYSGHGGQTDRTTDVREIDQRDEYMFVYDGQLMDDELGQIFDRMRNRISLVAIDACFAGGFAKDIITRPGRVGMFSSEEDVTSAVAGQFQAGGYLAHFLRLGIDGAADNDPHNNILTVGELTHYTWVQFGQHASDVRMSMGYQHLVIDRGAVPTTDVLWAVHR